MMRKSLIIAAALTMLFSVPAFAKIHCSVDNIQDNISYKAIKKIMYFNSVATIDFIKTIKPDESANYNVLVKFSNMRKKILETKAEVIVDGIPYTIEKAIPTFYIEQVPNLTIGYFQISPEIVNAIAMSKDNLIFKFYIRGNDPKELTFGEKEKQEIRLITTLKYNDFEKVDSGEISIK